MNSIRRITVRLNPAKSKDNEVIKFIDSIDKSKFRTVNNALVSALYDNIIGKPKEDNRSENAVDEILSLLKTALSEELPKLLITVCGNFIGNYALSDKIVKNNTVVSDENDIDMDFIGG